jgi:putative tryptophan/tyrosine transport system substrate-binding protein
MRRREFITLLGGAATGWPLATRAQQSPMPVVGILDSAGNAAPPFRKGLYETGYLEGRNVAIELRSTEQYGELPALATELVRRNVAVIAALGGLAAPAAKAATTTIPIVFSIGGDPVELGLVASLNHPGGNITGVTFLAAQLLQKQVDILHDLVPKAAVIGALVNPNNPRSQADASSVEAAARILGLQIVFASAGSEGELDAAYAGLAQRNVQALIIAGDALFLHAIKKLTSLAVRYRIAAIFTAKQYAQAGGLITYGASVADSFRQAGVYAGRVLRGEKPGDLPVMQPTKFELVINLQAAKAIGLDVPPLVQQLADEVIE